MFFFSFLVFYFKKITRSRKKRKEKKEARLITHIRLAAPSKRPPRNVVLKLAFTSRIASYHFIKLNGFY